MWALGILFYKMLTGKYPFVSKKSRSLMKRILRNSVKFPEGLEIKYVILLKKMLNKNPEQRPSVRKLLKYFENMRSE